MSIRGFVMIFHRVKEGEFKRLAETKSMTTLLAQESNNTNKFHIIGIDENNNIGYVIRHGRVDDIREWRLDILATVLKKFGFDHFEVRLRKTEIQP